MILPVVTILLLATVDMRCPWSLTVAGVDLGINLNPTVFWYHVVRDWNLKALQLAHVS